MTLREEIISAPRGTQARLVRQTGFSKKCIIGLLKHGRGGVRLAKALALAWGSPSRWSELLDDAPTANASDLKNAS